ncbi:MAG: hypothetical protein ACNA8W_15040 [Bradymonadaceae bacterium]
MDDVHIKYRTVTRKDRTGPVGRLLSMVAEHPIRTGIIGGLVVVLIAGVRAQEGVLNAPILAIALSVIVIFTWTILFYFMRTFFRQQTYFDVEVVREILIQGENFLWQEHGRVLRALSEPRVDLFTNPVPEEMIAGKKKKDLPWPVWLVISGKEGRFIVETKVTAKEAAEYGQVDADVTAEVDEKLPVQVASPLLMLVRE